MRLTFLHLLRGGLFVLTVSALTRSISAAPVRLHVAPNGNDSWSGQIAAPNMTQTDGPLVTLGRARDIVRVLRHRNQLPEGAIIEVGEGTYPFDAALELTIEDSGFEEAPTEFRAAEGKQVRLLGGRVVSDWKRVDDTAALDRLDPAARDQLMCMDLKKLGVADFGSPAGGGIELFFDGRAMTVSRWPNEGFIRIADVLGKTECDIRGTKGCAEGIFAYDTGRPDRWAEERDAWVHGYWFWDWSEQRHKIKSIDK